MRNDSGPNTDHCGAPQMIDSGADDAQFIDSIVILDWYSNVFVIVAMAKSNGILKAPLVFNDRMII